MNCSFKDMITKSRWKGKSSCVWHYGSQTRMLFKRFSLVQISTSQTNIRHNTIHWNAHINKLGLLQYTGLSVLFGRVYKCIYVLFVSIEPVCVRVCVYVVLRDDVGCRVFRSPSTPNALFFFRSGIWPWLSRPLRALASNLLWWVDPPQTSHTLG